MHLLHCAKSIILLFHAQRFPCQISDKWPSVSCPTPLNDRSEEGCSRWRFKVKMELRSLSVSLTHSPSSPKIIQPMRRPSVRPIDSCPPPISLPLSLPPALHPSNGAEKALWRERLRGCSITSLAAAEFSLLFTPPKPELGFHQQHEENTSQSECTKKQVEKELCFLN